MIQIETDPVLKDCISSARKKKKLKLKYKKKKKTMKTLSIQIKYNGIMTQYGIWNFFLRTESDSLLCQLYQ